jgi:hypothetical protein
MAGKLVQVATETVTSAVSSVQLIGTTTDDVYLVTVMGAEMSSLVDIPFRFTVSGTVDSSSNYDYASKRLVASSSFVNISATNQAQMDMSVAVSGSNDLAMFMIYIYNANNSSEYTFCTLESVNTSDSTAKLQGDMGGGVLTVSQATNGIEFFDNGATANITSGTFTLYRVV